MNLAETATVLRYAAAIDNRRTDDAVCVAWQRILSDVNYSDAMQAVTRHFHDSTEYLQPGHIVEIAKTIRAERDRNRPHEIRELPSRFEADTDRQRRARIGVAFCRTAIGLAPDGTYPLDANDPVRDRALRRAKSENPYFGRRIQRARQEHPTIDKAPAEGSRIDWTEFALGLEARSQAADQPERL